MTSLQATSPTSTIVLDPDGASAVPDPNEIVAKLSGAIRTGDVDSAKDLVTQLARLRLNLRINASALAADNDENEGKEFNVKVHVEDSEMVASFDLLVRSNDTVGSLKHKVCQMYKYPVESQRWIIGKKIPEDKKTLQECGIIGPDFTIFLYLVKVCASEQMRQEPRCSGTSWDNEYSTLQPSSDPSAMSNTMTYHSEGIGDTLCSPNTQVAAGSSDHTSFITEWENSPFKVSLDSDNVKFSDDETEPPAQGWNCSTCTFWNLPMRPGCEMCATDRPADYQVPGNYEPTEEEIALMQKEGEMERLARQKDQAALYENFMQWVKLDDVNLIPNTEAFTCPICMDDFEPGEGIILRECLHQFCKDCLEGAVTHNEEAALKCPYQDEVEKCETHLQEREIRALVSNETFVKYLQRGLDQAESQAANSFHCKTTDCKGWCLYADEVNFFACPICLKENCLTCKVIHEGKNCQQYQADLAAKALSDDAAKKTQDWVEQMVRNGEAMHCPQCKIIIQKKDGCDWMKCSVCKTEICWVTKGPRWGPQGNGDTSAGCRCGVNGKRCHPKCGNCH